MLEPVYIWVTSHHAQDEGEYPLVFREDYGGDQHVQRVRWLIVNVEEVQSPKQSN